MKILCTADWHIGKKIEAFSRLEEQKEILEEICTIADTENVDAVIVAGDCFDSQTPNPEMVRLFSDVLAELSQGGKRLVIVIAGNHDNPYFLNSFQSFSSQLGILILGFPSAIPHILESHSSWLIQEISPGMIQIFFKKRKKSIRFLLSPYANAQRLKKDLGINDVDKKVFDLLHASWENHVSKEDNCTHILITHQFLLPERKDQLIQCDDPVEDEGERSIVGTLGAMSLSYVPDGIDYVISGHIHKYQALHSPRFKAYYVGSPLIYSLSESGQEKKVLILDLTKKHKEYSLSLSPKRDIKQIIFRDFQKISEILEKEKNHYLILTWIGDYYFSAEELQKIYTEHPHILRVESQVQSKREIVDLTANLHSDSLETLFENYFSSRHNGSMPPEDLILAFKECLSEESQQEFLQRKSGFLPKKILIKGFYSYKKAVEIDFTRFQDKKFFGIFGETGSGKSALIEAMIICLFGRVERIGQLSAQSRGQFKTYYNAMNIESQDLLIEFVFEINGLNGKEEYLCRMQSERDKKNPLDFKKNKREFFILDQDEWIPIDHANGEKILGIKYDDFRKTIVLQQEDFLGFISEDPKSNADTLKRLFCLHRFDLFDQVLARKQIFDKEKEIVDLQVKKLEDVSEELLASHKLESESIDLELETVEKEYARVQTKKVELQSLRDKIQRQTQALQEKEKLDAQKEHFDKARLHHKVRDIINEDERISEAKSILADIDKVYPELQIQHDEMQNRLKNLEIEQSQLKLILEDARNIYSEKIKKKEKHLSEKFEIEREYQKLSFYFKEIEEIECSLLKNKELREELSENIKNYEAKESSFSTKCLKLKHSIRLNYVADLLKSENPCPLCGSKEHPEPFLANDQFAKDLDELEFQYQKYLKKKSEWTQIVEKEEHFHKKIQDYLGDFSSKKDLEKELDFFMKKKNLIDKDMFSLELDLQNCEENLLKYNQKYTKCENEKYSLTSYFSSICDKFKEMNMHKLHQENIWKNAKINRDKLFLEKELSDDQYLLIKNYPFVDSIDIDHFFILYAQNKKELEMLEIDNLFLNNNLEIEISEVLCEEIRLSSHIKLLSQKKGFCESFITRMEIDLAEQKKLRLLRESLNLKQKNFHILLTLFKGQGFVKFIGNKYLNRLCISANRRLLAFTRNHFEFSPSDGGRDTKIVITDRLASGKERDIITLSGGQRFQAALSLSLALADESATGHRFFFVDEGFGSLDEQSLLTVLDTLHTVTVNENRIVGLISHVQKIKEYVDLCLHVDKDQILGTQIFVE